MRGADTTFQEWSITPLSSNQYWYPNDVIKIMGNISEGLMDPYRSHIQFQLEVTSQMLPVGGVQIDSSAQSLIDQTVLLSNQDQIERIQEYSTLAAILTDLGFSQTVTQSRSGQGLGYTNIPTNLPQVATKGNAKSQSINVSWAPAYATAPQYVVESGACGTFSPILAPQPALYAGMVSNKIDNSTDIYANTLEPTSIGGSYRNFSNFLTFPFVFNKVNYAAQWMKTAGRGMGVRSQYLLLPQTNGYPDAPDSFPLTSPFVSNQTWDYNNMLQQGFSPNNPYVTQYNKPSALFPEIPTLTPLAPTTCGVGGYVKPIAPQYCTGCNEPFLSATLPQVQMREGRILPQPIPISRKTFRIPLISAILGILIPPDQFQLIPVAALKNILLQITLNPYALFTSGYSDTHQYDTTGMLSVNMQKRLWKINSFEWVWHLYTFRSSQIQAQLQTKLTRGIMLSSNYWQLSAQYQLPNGTYVRNTFQIPVNVESLAEICIVFLSNEYLSKSFCRKQFRLSNNITSMQFKVNGVYYPLQPITGNAGNPETVDSTGDNWNFYQPLLLSNNFLFNTNVPLPRINQKNFAINGRFYDTNNSQTYLPLTSYNLSESLAKQTQPFPKAIAALNSFTNKSINTDTAMGQSWFHQNRYRGTAIFDFSFEPYGHSREFITGLDTRNFRQFDVTFNNTPTNQFPSDQTMYIFTRANVVVRYTQRGVQILGV